MTTRLEALRPRLAEAGAEALLVSSLVNLRYLLERPALFDSHFSGLLLATQGTADLFVDFRYAEQAEKSGLAATVRQYRDSVVEAVSGRVSELGVGRLGVEADYITLAAYNKLAQQVGAELVATTALVERLRQFKDETEIESLASAAAIADKAFDLILEAIKPGLKERDLALEIEYQVRRLGAQASSFEPVVAGGPNSAMPHAQAGEREFRRGDLVKIDFGAVVDGYHSDMTRTFVLGRATDEQREIYSHVAAAQQRVLDRLSTGVAAADMDAVARQSFAEVGYAERFGHNLGHGVGLEVHELPTLGPKSQDRLETGMVFTVEPGLYLPGFGGVRIEDMVVLTSEGVRILTKTPKALIEL